MRLFSNPVFRQELRTQFHGNAFYRQGLFWGIAIACTLLSLTLRNSQAPFLGAAFIGLLLLPPAGAVGFAREIESGNLDFLRSSALTHGEIFSGKLAAAAVSALCAATAAVCVALVGRLLTCLQQEADSTWPALLGSLLDSLLRGAALSVALTLLVTIASCCSIFCRRSLHAILISYGLAFTLHVGGALIAVYGGLRPADRSDSFPQLGWLALESASPLVLFSSHRNWTPAGLGNDVVDLVLAITLQLCFLLVLCGVARWQLRRVLAGTTSDARC